MDKIYKTLEEIQIEYPKIEVGKFAQDFSNLKFGSLTVLYRTKNDNKYRTNWVCQCECGNITETTTYKLRTGHTQSCGCLQKEKTSQVSLIDLTGRRFGMLTVLYRDPQSIKRVYWYCKCDCGKIKRISGLALNRMDDPVRSCGCKTKSNGELKITQLLEEANIPYKTEYQFYDCINPKTNRKLRFDFYVDNKYLIEFDGKQHTLEQPDSKWKKDTLEEIRYRDEIKNKYCKKNNIPLIRIPYIYYNQMCLEDLLLETTQFLY